MYTKIKEFFAGLGVGLVKRFLLYLFGGAPPTDDVESLRLWCLKNHRWIALVARKTSNAWDDVLSEILLKILQNDELLRTLWDIATNTETQPEIDSSSIGSSGLFAGIREAIARRRNGNGIDEMETGSAVAVLGIVSTVVQAVSAVRLIREFLEKRKAVQ